VVRTSDENAATLVFLEAAYAWERGDRFWLQEVLQATGRIWPGVLWSFGYFYDASDPRRMRAWNVCDVCAPPVVRDAAVDVVTGYPPEVIARTYRSTWVGSFAQVRDDDPITARILDDARAADTFILNGLDAEGLGCVVGAATSELVDTRSPLLNRLAVHLSSAYRCRRRLRASRAGRTGAGPPSTDGRSGAAERWWPRVQGRWTLVDAYTRDGERYVVARENPSAEDALAALTDRERQVVAGAASGLRNKEIAYQLGLSDSTVRVLIARACARLGVGSRAALLQLPSVRALQEPSAEPR
jgi:DNA-binding CsgD family transcriptional regulator